jgi:hypothetical protein
MKIIIAYFIKNFEFDLKKDANLGMKFLFTHNPSELEIIKLKIIWIYFFDPITFIFFEFNDLNLIIDKVILNN